MAVEGTDLVCLISLVQGDEQDEWKKLLERSIKESGFIPKNYSADEVDEAACLLAFAPYAEQDVFYQVAYAMGRGVPVISVVPTGLDLSPFDPKPKHAVRIAPGSPAVSEQLRKSVKDELDAIRATAPAPANRLATSSRAFANQIDSVSATVSTVDQAEKLFAEFVADGLTERLIHRLLLEAGCRRTWVEFRLKQQFGGW